MTSIGNRVILAATVGAVVFLAAELYQAGRIVETTQREGVTVTMAGARVKVKPPAGGTAVELPASAERMGQDMHRNAAMIAGAALVAVLLVV